MFLTAVCFCNFFLKNWEVLKSALSEFSMAINQAFFNLTQKLCQGEQQQEAHDESAPIGYPGREGGPTDLSTSKGTRELRSKRKHNILEQSLGEIRSDKEESHSDEESLQDYANFNSCDTGGDEDSDGDDITAS